MRPRIAVSTGTERGGGAWSLDPYVDWVGLEGESGPSALRRSLRQVDGWLVSVGTALEPVRAAPPSLPVEDEDGLGDEELREHFIERVFGHADLRDLFEAEWRPGDLVEFHARHKLQIMAHDPARYREIGRLVASAGTLPRARIETEYRELFMSALAQPPSRGRHTNALQHMFGYFSGRLGDTRRRHIIDVIDAYGRGEVPLTEPMALLHHHIETEHIGYLAAQTYFAPFPADLRGQRPS